MKPRDDAMAPAGPAAWLAMGVIRAYQWIVSPFLGANCRYLPTCSEYAREAIARHGAVRGSAYALRRMGRCHPWGGSGYDPVPPSSSDPSSSETER